MTDAYRANTDTDQLGTAVCLITPRCVNCKADIRLGAAICKECKSPQDWTRYLFVWKDIGTAVLALVPLWAGAFALLNLVFKHPDIDVHAVTALCTHSNVVLAFVNDGENSAAVQDPIAKVVNQGRTTDFDENELRIAKNTSYPYVLTPKQPVYVSFERYIGTLQGEFPTRLRGSSDGSCELIFDITFRGFKDTNLSHTSARCPCPVEES